MREALPVPQLSPLLWAVLVGCSPEVLIAKDTGEAGGGPPPPSCATGGPGVTDCGPDGESCCASLPVTGGTFYRTYVDNGGGPTGEADPATVDSFRLDKYLVTVGRFRQFVRAWDGGAGWMPPQGSGVHAHLFGGLGLVNVGASADAGPVYEQGWNAADWNNGMDLDPTGENLDANCKSPYATWSDAPGAAETLPINCITWYEAYAFCIWDGGFLPSAAEWEYAAAGGARQREYPWGSTPPGTANAYAIYGAYYGSSGIAPVGTATLGAGAWGQFDLAGEVLEWVLDGNQSAYTNPCDNCAYLPASWSSRVARGGDFTDVATSLLPTGGLYYGAQYRTALIGFRCARIP